METLNLDFDKKSETEVIKNPFPGLRPFKYEESHLYFGRENQIDEVLNKLVSSRFVSIIGTSGIGKSSFIYCGIFPALYGDYPTQASSKWEIFTMRPGASPIKNLAKALVYNDLIDFEDSEKNDLSENIEYALLKKDSNGLVESIGSKYQQFPRNYLIFIDQFEEIFRFKDIDTHSHEETIAFIKLIANAVYQSEVPIYVALTMRSDFMGDCSQYSYLTKLINDSQFLIPQMTRNEKREAITGPVKVMNGTIDEALTQKILNDIGDSTDQLPIMQHALMRTWDYWQRTTSGKDVISITDYEAIGGMSQALSIHANEAYNELDEKEKKICEKLFRTITEKSAERGIRKPTKLKEIASIANASIEEVIKVINHFRSPERTLLMPPSNVVLDGETVIDISHESLMRIWVTLNKWVEEEAESSKSYLRLAENAEKHQQGKNSLLRSPDLQIALNWREEEKPTLLWGLRYHPAYERTMLYLDFSQKEFEREQKNKEKQQKRRIFLSRLIAGIFGFGGIIAVLLLLLAEEQRQLAEKKTIEANSQKQIAEEQGKEAALQKERAQLESEKAKKQAELAEEQRKIALNKEEEAQKQAKIAKLNAELAEIQKREAILAQREAVKQGEIAKEQSKKAQVAEADAYRGRLLSTARSMAVKSLQEPDSIRKALMAQQAYNFHSKNGGYEKDHDIYDGLYYALKSIKGEEFNKYNVHSANVRSFVSNPNNNYMYSAGSDGKIVRWDSKSDSATPEVIINNPGKVHRAVAISPDNKYLAYAGEYSFINLYELNNLGGKPKVLKTNTYQVWYLAFTNDNKLISIGKDFKILEWDGTTSREITTSDFKINDVTVNPINGLIVVGKSDGTVLQIDRITNLQQIVYQHPNKIATSAIEFSANGKWLIVGSEDGALTLINQQTQEVTTLVKHRAQVNNVTFSPNSNLLATGSWDKTVKIWNLAKLAESPIVVRDHNDWVWSIAFSPDSEKIFAGCRDFMVRAWPTRTSKLAEMLCKEIKRNMTEIEWNTFVGQDIPYEKTCNK